jgi:hypothetical protein
MKKQIKTVIPIENIVLDEELYPRNQYFWQTAYDYSESMKTGVKFPPVVVAKMGNAFILVDGKHRIEAYRILKVKTVEAEVLIGLSRNQILEEAIKRNIAHGKTLSIQEKLRLAVKLRDLKYSTDTISRLIQIPNSKLVDLLNKRLFNTITGEEIILKKPFENLSTSTMMQTGTGDIDLIQSSFQGESQEKMVENLIILLKTNAIDLTNKKVAVKLHELKTILRKFKV